MVDLDELQASWVRFCGENGVLSACSVVIMPSSAGPAMNLLLHAMPIEQSPNMLRDAADALEGRQFQHVLTDGGQDEGKTDHDDGGGP